MSRELGQSQHMLPYKNGYEIRTQLLEIAQKYLQAQYELNLEIYRKLFNESMKAGYATQLEVEKYLPKMYQFSEIVEYAKQLNDFVSNPKKD